MAWQDIYGEVWDDCNGSSHTSSRRGIVKTIGFHVLTNSIGTPIDICVSAGDRDKEISEGDIKRKIQEWKNKESHTKSKDSMITYWENKLKMAQSQNAGVKAKNKVRVLLTFPSITHPSVSDKELLVHFEGTELDINDLKNLRDNTSKFRQFLDELKNDNI